MEQLLEKMQACRRQLELEDRLPAWERQLQERKAQISEMTENLKQKEQALEKLGNPGFLQRLSGKTGVQKEKNLHPAPGNYGSPDGGTEGSAVSGTKNPFR